MSSRRKIQPYTRPRVVCRNPRWGGWWAAPFRALFVLPVWVAIVAGVVASFWLADVTQYVPETPPIHVPLEGHASSIYATDGTRVGGLLRGRRPRSSHQEIPARVRFAFLAAEDDAFFEHEGFDPVAIVRAFLRNRAVGRVVEGGSTITQQLAKYYLGNEKTYRRKLIELFLARRIESTFSKAEILESYLNEVYLGGGAYGVRAASEIYFGKDMEELTWPEAAMIAAMASSPSRFNPFRRPERALARRRLVLLRLSRLGVFPEEEAEALAKEPLALHRFTGGDEDTIPHAAVEVREELRRSFGAEAMKVGSFDVTLSVSPVLQEKARRAMTRGLGRLDRRQGYRGPLAVLPRGRWDEADEAIAEVYGVEDSSTWKPMMARPYLARVTKVEERSLRANLGGVSVEVPYEGARWASVYEAGSKKNEVWLSDLRTQFAEGELILVAYDRYAYWRQTPGNRRNKEPDLVEGWRIGQVPRVEGVLLSTEVDTGYARAMIGGWDFDRSEFNRAIKGCRQPGSVFKPVVYSKALERGMTTATVLSDTPVKVEKAGGEVWTPKNADNDFSGFLLMRDALARSRNLPSVEVFQRVGKKEVVRHAKKLGITTEMAVTEALSLGASCVKPWDLMRVYGTFARRGVRMEPRLLLTVAEHRGEVLEDFGHFVDLSVPTLARLDRMVRSELEPLPRIMREDHTYLLLQMLRAVVYAGTAYGATQVGVPAAGKTGTTNLYDAWFVGFTESVLTTVWVGDDGGEGGSKRPLGRRESGGSVALPVWVEYMKGALDGREQGSVVGEVPEGVEIQRIDREYGLRAKEGEPGVDLPFLEGSAPKRFAPDRKEKSIEKVDRISSDF